jgi:hypothetical protein
MFPPSLLVLLSFDGGLVDLQLRAWTRPFRGRAFGEQEDDQAARLYPSKLARCLFGAGLD